MDLDPAEPGLRAARGSLPTKRSGGGGWPSWYRGEPPGAEVQCYVRPTRGIVPPGKTHSPSPSGLGYHENAGVRGRRCCCCEKSSGLTLQRRIVSFDTSRCRCEKGVGYDAQH